MLTPLVGFSELHGGRRPGGGRAGAQIQVIGLTCGSCAPSAGAPNRPSALVLPSKIDAWSRLLSTRDCCTPPHVTCSRKATAA